MHWVKCHWRSEYESVTRELTTAGRIELSQFREALDEVRRNNMEQQAGVEPLRIASYFFHTSPQLRQTAISHRQAGSHPSDDEG